MGIFIGNLVGFAFVLLILWRYVVPPVKRMMDNQQAAIAEQMAASEAAKARLAESQEAHAKALETARAESSQIREEARGDAQAIGEELSSQALSEAERIKQHGAAQVDLNRSNIVRGLRGELGVASVEVADALVREHLKDPAAQSDSVDRFLTELEQMADSRVGPLSSAGGAERAGTGAMRAASRDSLRGVQQEFEAAAAGLSTDELTKVADDLAAVADVLSAQHVLRKHLAEASDDTTAKVALVDRLFGGKIGAPATAVVRSAAGSRWSQHADLSKAIERIARIALLIVAERDNKASDTEDELFRVGRLLVAEPALTGLLSDVNAPLDGRLRLLDTVVGPKVNNHTKGLLEQTVRLLRSHRCDSAVADVAELAAARRGESVAQVVAAIAPSAQQVQRLTAVLGRIYARSMSVQTEVDPALLGGLKITVGDEVIEGDVATRLAKAAENLPS